MLTNSYSNSGSTSPRVPYVNTCRNLHRVEREVINAGFNLHNHANAIVACDFLTVVTATFKCLYVFVVIELGTRKLRHINVTNHPKAAWTLQQLREAISPGHPYKYLLHDRDSIFSAGLDGSVTKIGLRILKSPYHSPLANCICERVIGSLRRECLDFLIPITPLHLLRTVKAWATYYNTVRPHMSLGPEPR